MRLIALFGILALATMAAAQTCPPAGCKLTCSGGDFFVFQCNATQPFHFVGDDVPPPTQFTEHQGPAGFDGTGLMGDLTIGSTSVMFKIGSANQNSTLTTNKGDTCVGTSGVTYLNFPMNPITIDDRGVPRVITVSKRNPLLCESGTRTLLCLRVNPVTAAPFPTDLGCDVDRLDFVCGVVS